MNNFIPISKAAQRVHTTSETLRHYDRIGLVQPSIRDEWTGYRYYSEQDIIRLHTVRALQNMDLSLSQIKEMLEYDDPHKIVAFLEQAEQRADAKIAELEYGKEKIRKAKESYQNQIHRAEAEADLRYFPRRVILLSDTVRTATIENLWSYLRHFYAMTQDKPTGSFEFEDKAGVYTERGESWLFAVCIRCSDHKMLKVLPEGQYFCTVCNEEDRKSALQNLVSLARKECYGQSWEPEWVVEDIILSGILQWKYLIQIYAGNTETQNPDPIQEAPADPASPSKPGQQTHRKPSPAAPVGRSRRLPRTVCGCLPASQPPAIASNNPQMQSLVGDCGQKSP